MPALSDKFTSLDFNGAKVRSALAWKLIVIYLIGSSVAFSSNILLGPFGLDFNHEHLMIAARRGMPYSIGTCLAADIFLILILLRPIQKIFDARTTVDAARAKHIARAAFARAVNLPAITILRVEFVHLPLGALSIIIPLYLSDLDGRYGFQFSQYAGIAIIGLINATIHSIVEYFLVSRLMARVLDHIQTHYKSISLADCPGVMFVNVRVKFFFVTVFIAFMPLVALALTLMLRAGGAFRDAGEAAFIMETLAPWSVLFIAVSTVTSLVIAYILSREIIDPVNALKNAMKDVEKGRFDQRLNVTAADEFSELFYGFNSMTEGLREREMIKSKFGKYVSKEILSQILNNDAALGGEEKEVTILFSDIRDYTGMSEKMTPAETVDFLNAYFSEMVKIVEEHGGVLDKFIGDALMAVFGLGAGNADHAGDALRAAAAMRQNLTIMNRSRAGKSAAEIKIGIGLSTGTVLVGNIGSESRMEYTVIGDAVNLAARLESLTKDTGCSILFPESTMAGAGNAFDVRRVGQFEIKGKAEPCDVYTLDS